MAGHRVPGKKEERNVESKSSSLKGGQMVQENDEGNKGSGLVLTMVTDRTEPKGARGHRGRYQQHKVEE